ncbi:MAG: Rrf2 family transcriptional regulator [Propionivibrio sp.]|uniref:Rrf2 family transcriptional regulator n=1 Tax=Candidatus Propionivibrio dominans TaxID=2954373 RepID=A0A9D7IGG8_9RHOO|nr:Rrf2 family transcriptional regulator [Candidatus Propionivibrio dominans]
MRLSTFSDYNLRVLMYLGVQSDRLATIAEIADAHKISESHLMKVVHQLGRSGYIETVRGKGGGMRLATAPKEIVLGNVIRQTEGEIAMAECFTEKSACRIEPACRLKSILGEALSALFLVLDDYTLADLLEKPQDHLKAIRWRESTSSVHRTDYSEFAK